VAGPAERQPLLALACLNMLDVCLGIRLEHYLGLYHRDCKQRKRETHQAPREANKLVRLAIQFGRQDHASVPEFRLFSCFVINSSAFRE
jgi:hypothetical protein